MLEFIRTVQKKAYKEYICDLCGGMIRKKCEYIHETQRVNGQYKIYRRHIHCDALLNALFTGALRGQYEYDTEEIISALEEVCETMKHLRQCPKQDETRDCDDVELCRCEAIQGYMIPDTQIRKEARHSVRQNAR